MTVENKAPEIRLQGFSRDWQDKEIGSILVETKRPVELLDNELYQLVTVKRRNEGVVPRAILKGKDILVKNYYGIRAGDYLISKRQVVHGANGIVPESLDNAVVSNEYLVVSDNNEITAKFWTVISKRPEMHKLFFISSYGVDIEKLVFDVTDWKNRTISLPEKNEQNAITDCFQNLDSLINQHQQKHDKLSNIKKAMLEKMFPKVGETVPEIRFKGFSGEWEERELEKVFTYERPDKYIVQSAEYSNEYSTPVLTANKGFLLGYTNEESTYNEPSIIFDDFTLDSKFVDFPYMVKSSAIKILLVKDSSKDDLLFAFHLLNTARIEVMGHARHYLSVVQKTKVNIPEKSEQLAISNYFQKLDALINQHQQQITKLNNIKQACLSKMFV